MVDHRQASREVPSNSSSGVTGPALASGVSWNQSNAASMTGLLPVLAKDASPMRGLTMPAMALSVCGIAVQVSPSAE